MDLKNIPLNLHDLSPQEARLTLSGGPNALPITMTLCRWTLRVRAWAIEKYSHKGLQQIFEKQMITEIADLAFFMLKEKELFASKDEFMDAVVTTQDQINLIKALLHTVGIGEPEIDKLGKAFPEEKKEGPPSPNVPSPNLRKKKTGAKSSTP